MVKLWSIFSVNLEKCLQILARVLYYTLYRYRWECTHRTNEP